MKIDFNTAAMTVHLVVDMQPLFLDGLDPAKKASLISDMDSFLEKTAHTAHPIYIQTYNDDIFDPELSAKFDLAVKVIHSPVLDAWDRKLVKTASSAFRPGLQHSDLHNTLQRLGCENILVSGINRSVCPWETALDARELGYNVAFLDDLTVDPEIFKQSPRLRVIDQEACAEKGIQLIGMKDYLDLHI